MKTTYSLLLISIALFLAGCAENPGRLNLSGTVKNTDSGTIYLQRYENKSFFTIDSTRIIDGKFSFSNKVNLPEIFGLALQNSGNPFHSFLIFLDPNPITVELDTVNTFENTRVSGSKEHDLFSELSKNFRIPINEILKDNPSSLAALYVFYRYYSYRLSPDEIRQSIQLLDPSFRNTEYVKVLSELAENLENVSIGNKAPDFRAETAGEQMVNLSDYLGKGYVLVDFWASWCVPCRKENPKLVALYEKYKDRGFEIIGVSLDNNTRPWLLAIEKDGLPWPQLIDKNAWAGEGVSSYGVRLIPYKFLIDKDGIIVAKNLRDADLDELVGSFLQ
jgi:peroxiredoxin